jgi:ubiquinone/menaquinone biosynthesis C-methylase UbiE
MEHMGLDERRQRAEIERIGAEYRRRNQEIPADFYSLERPANRFLVQRTIDRAHRWLRELGFFERGDPTTLDVGCGAGDWLVAFLRDWGLPARSLAGIDLMPDRIEAARRALTRVGTPSGSGAAVDLRCGDATHLPWPDASFDLVVQSTLFTSVLYGAMRRAIAEEMVRVLRPGGFLLWHDFFLNNPRNRNVRGVRAREIQALFSGCDVSLRRVTLVAPLARAIVPLSWRLAVWLEAFPLLRSHYLGVIRVLNRALLLWILVE